MKTAYVLDAWALLAFVQKEEPAQRRVEALLTEASTRRVTLSMSWINLGEVYYRLARSRSPELADTVMTRLQRLPVQWASPTADMVMAAARIKAEYRLSYADAFAAALTREMDATLVTGDPDFDALSAIIRVEKLVRDRPPAI